MYSCISIGAIQPRNIYSKTFGRVLMQSKLEQQTEVKKHIILIH